MRFNKSEKRIEVRVIHPNQDIFPLWQHKPQSMLFIESAEAEFRSFLQRNMRRFTVSNEFLARLECRIANL